MLSSSKIAKIWAGRTVVAALLVCSLFAPKSVLGNTQQQSPLPMKEHHVAIQDIEGLSQEVQDLIEQAYQLGVFVGDEQGKFLPDQSMTRAEAAVMLDRLFHLEKETGGLEQSGELSTIYRDVPSSHWASASIEAVDKAGLIHGTGDQFLPSNAITREELVTALVQGLEQDPDQAFQEGESLVLGAIDPLQMAANLGIIADPDGDRTHSDELITRREAALVAVLAANGGVETQPSEETEPDNEKLDSEELDIIIPGILPIEGEVIDIESPESKAPELDNETPEVITEDAIELESEIVEEDPIAEDIPDESTLPSENIETVKPDEDSAPNSLPEEPLPTVTPKPVVPLVTGDVTDLMNTISWAYGVKEYVQEEGNPTPEQSKAWFKAISNANRLAIRTNVTKSEIDPVVRELNKVIRNYINDIDVSTDYFDFHSMKSFSREIRFGQAPGQYSETAKNTFLQDITEIETEYKKTMQDYKPGESLTQHQQTTLRDLLLRVERAKTTFADGVHPSRDRIITLLDEVKSSLIVSADSYGHDEGNTLQSAEVHGSLERSVRYLEAYMNKSDLKQSELEYVKQALQSLQEQTYTNIKMVDAAQVTVPLSRYVVLTSQNNYSRKDNYVRVYVQSWIAPETNSSDVARLFFSYDQDQHDYVINILNQKWGTTSIAGTVEVTSSDPSLMLVTPQNDIVDTILLQATDKASEYTEDVYLIFKLKKNGLVSRTVKVPVVFESP